MQPCTQDIKPVLIACFAACEANGNCADAARAHKRTDTCGFRPLVNLPFPLDSLAQIADMQPLRNKGTAEDFFFRVFRNLFAGSDNVLLHRSATFSRRDITVSRNSLTCCNARHLRIRRLVQFILADPVYNNALKDRAALLCRACEDFPVCVAVRCL